MPNDTRDDLRALLTRAASDLPNQAPLPERTLRRARRRMVGTIGALTLVLCVAVGGLLAVSKPLNRSQPAQQPQKPPGVWLVNVDTGAETQLAGLPKSAFWFSASHDGSTIAFTAGHGTREQVFVMTAAGSDLRKVTHETYGASEPTLSPDGSEVAYKALDARNHRNVFVVSTDGTGTPEQLTYDRKDVASLAWSPSGGSILYSVAIPGKPAVGTSWGSSRLEEVDLATRETTHLAGGSREAADFGTWSGNGREIAYMTGNEWTDEAYGFEPAQIGVMESDGTLAHEIASFDQRAFELAWRPWRHELALTIQETDGRFEIYLLDATTGESRRVTDGLFPVWLDVHTLIIVR
jgi:Tol biopolymer transport system component